MNLLDILSPDCIAVPLKATDKRGVINELVDVLAESGKVTNPEQLKDSRVHQDHRHRPRPGDPTRQVRGRQ